MIGIQLEHAIDESARLTLAIAMLIEDPVGHDTLFGLLDLATLEGPGGRASIEPRQDAHNIDGPLLTV